MFGGSLSFLVRPLSSSSSRRMARKGASSGGHSPRPRSSSIPMLGSRRKHDVAREVWRKARDIPSWPAPLKVVLFVVLFFALWFCCFFTAPATTRQTPAHAPMNKSTSKYTAPPSAPASGLSSSTARPPSINQPEALDLTEPPMVTPVVVRSLPHDSNAFTQGLVIHEGAFYESTGLYGQSTVRRVDPSTGVVQDSWSLPNREFGEGLCLVDDQLVQLTWREHVGYLYSRANFTAGPIRTFTYPMDGWGITYDGDSLLLSDGSSTIYYLDPATYSIQRRLTVQWAQKQRLHEVRMLNELEFIDGMIYANIWMTNYIIIIDPATGLVRKAIDCSQLHPNPRNQEMTLNGIAFDEQERKLFITGKLWPTIFEIEYIGVETTASRR